LALCATARGRWLFEVFVTAIPSAKLASLRSSARAINASYGPKAIRASWAWISSAWRIDLWEYSVISETIPRRPWLTSCMERTIEAKPSVLALRYSSPIFLNSLCMTIPYDNVYARADDRLLTGPTPRTGEGSIQIEVVSVSAWTLFSKVRTSAFTCAGREVLWRLLIFAGSFPHARSVRGFCWVGRSEAEWQRRSAKTRHRKSRGNNQEG